MFSRKALFWLAVAGTSCIAPFGLRLAADKIPSDGLKKLVAYINSAPGGSQ